MSNLKSVKNILWLVVFSLLVFSARAFCGPPRDFTNGKYDDRIKGFRYLTVSAGAGAWYKSLQPGLDNQLMPFSLFAEYGRTSVPVSIVAGSCFRTVFSIDRFIMKTDYMMAGFQYVPFSVDLSGGTLNLYCIAGAGLSYARFTENIYPGIINYEYKEERGLSVVPAAGVGTGYRKGNWELKPVLFYFGGRSDFFAGHFTKQTFGTGSLQLQVMICHRFVFDNNRGSCPAYRKFISF